MHEMHDISDLDPDGLPSNKSLLKATLVALLVAILLLVIVVLPAEYGIDPTGLGKKMGLTAINRPQPSPNPPAAAKRDPEFEMEAASPLRKSQQAYRSDAMTLTLQPGRGAEIKAIMQAGGSFVFDWQITGGVVYFDMHGDPPNADGDTFTSFWIDEGKSQARGNFTAPFQGNHGWYWENRGTEPVTLQLKTSGFYDSLFMP